jgi:hypothetical protein
MSDDRSMTHRPPVDRLLDEVQEEHAFDGVPPTVLDDLEETFEDEGILPLYQVAWTMSGSVSRDDERFEALCRIAYDTFLQHHPDLRLVWVPWPIDLAQARPAAPDTPIDLDLDPDASVDTPLLALVAPEDLPA